MHDWPEDSDNWWQCSAKGKRVATGASARWGKFQKMGGDFGKQFENEAHARQYEQQCIREAKRKFELSKR